MPRRWSPRSATSGEPPSADRVLAHVPELERDITGLPMIERMARMMYGTTS